jgi:hypothetical protein
MPIPASSGQPTWRPRVAIASNSPTPVKATPVAAAAQSLAVVGSRTSCTRIRARVAQVTLVKCQAKRRTTRARPLAKTPSRRASSGPINRRSPNTECAKAVMTSSIAAVKSRPSDMVKLESPCWIRELYPRYPESDFGLPGLTQYRANRHPSVLRLAALPSAAVKRVASAVGEGAMAVQFVHECLKSK